MNVLARTTSSVVTPNSLFLLYTPAFLSTSAHMGTVELTGLLMMSSAALGATCAATLAMLATMPALMEKRSSRDMPGLRGTPAGTTMTSASFSAPAMSSPANAFTLAGVSM